MITYFEAVHELVGGAISGSPDGPVSKITFLEGQTPPTEEAIQAKLLELKSEYDSLDYHRKRKEEFKKYPIAEQLDYIFHNGLTKWKTDIVQPIKDKFPKP
tara:strand:- start:748 stop:1050 length:303 start_codon:yes stop_codon:yes gene_type:complete